MNRAESDELTHLSFPKEHRTKPHLTNLLEHVNGKLKSCPTVIGTLNNATEIIWLLNTILLEQNGNWLISAPAA